MYENEIEDLKHVKAYMQIGHDAALTPVRYTAPARVAKSVGSTNAERIPVAPYHGPARL